MKDVTVYKYGNKLKVTFCYLPEPRMDVTVNEKETTSLNLGLFFDFIRIMNSFVARQKKMLSYMVKGPINEHGNKTLIKATEQKETEPKDQLEMFT